MNFLTWKQLRHAILLGRPGHGSHALLDIPNLPQDEEHYSREVSLPDHFLQPGIDIHSANITTRALIGTLIYQVIFYGFLFIPPYRLPMFFRISFYMVLSTIVGMFIWAMVTNHGPGEVLSPTKDLTPA